MMTIYNAPSIAWRWKSKVIVWRMKATLDNKQNIMPDVLLIYPTVVILRSQYR